MVDVHPNRRMAVATAVLVLVASMFTIGPAAADGGAESRFLQLLNDERSAAGLPGLSLDSGLSTVARDWSEHMATTGALSHNPALQEQVTGWTSIAENVGMGADVDSIHRALMASSGHRANILGDFDRVGVGVATADGLLWVTFDFVESAAGVPDAPPAPEPEPEQQPEPEPQREGQPEGQQPPVAPAPPTGTDPKPPAELDQPADDSRQSGDRDGRRSRRGSRTASSPEAEPARSSGPGWQGDSYDALRLWALQQVRYSMTF